MVNNPFLFPYGGKMNVYSLKAPQSWVGDEIEILNIPTGNSGVVRRIQIISEETGGNQQDWFKNVILNICYDGEVTPSVSIPYASLCGMEWMDGVTGNWEPTSAGVDDAAVFVPRPFETPFWVATNQIGKDISEDINQSHILKYQIPYTNGIHIYLSRTTSDTPASFWNNVYYQDSLPACWNRNYRFLASRSDENTPAPVAGSGTITISGVNVTGVGTNFTSADVGKYLVVGIIEALIVSVTDTTHLTLGSNESLTASGSAYKITSGHTWLSRPAGSVGYLAAVTIGLDGSSAAMLESNPRINLNQNAACDDLIWTGTEDFLSCAFYFDTMQENSLGGVVSWNTTSNKLSAYACFADMPINYTNGITGRFPCVESSAVQCNWTSVYYELQ